MIYIFNKLLDNKTSHATVPLKFSDFCIAMYSRVDLRFDLLTALEEAGVGCLTERILRSALYYFYELLILFFTTFFSLQRVLAINKSLIGSWFKGSKK